MELAERQNAVFAVWQLEAVGVSNRSVFRRAHAHHLHRRFRGVYSIGHTKLTVEGHWMAAVLACGPAALLCHRSAAALFDLRPIPGGPIDVTAPGQRRHDGICCHTSQRLHPDDQTVVNRSPVTTAERLMLDLTPSLPDQRLVSYLEALERRDRLDAVRFQALFARVPGHRGLTRLRAALVQLTGAVEWPRSRYEQRFLELLRAAGLLPPQST